MSSPLEQFSNLSLGSPMAASDAGEFEHRKFIIQDWLSSFVRDTLPSEYRPDLFRAIHQDQRGRDFEWTIQGDPLGSLSQWAAHDDGCFDLLQRMQAESTRSRLFHEKVTRRLADEFDRYKLLEQERSGSATEIRQDVREISKHIWDIVEAARDRQEFYMRAVSAEPIVKALLNVCENHLDLAGGTNRTRASLFHMLIRDPEEGKESFLLDLLEWMITHSVRALQPHRSILDQISERLSTLNAPEHYQHTFNRIVEAVASSVEDTAPRSPPPPPPPPPPPGGGGGGPSGTKRRAADTPGRKGGRRKTAA